MSIIKEHKKTFHISLLQSDWFPFHSYSLTYASLQFGKVHALGSIIMYIKSRPVGTTAL